MRCNPKSIISSCILAGACFLLANGAAASGGDGAMENSFTPENHVPASELQNYAHDNLRLVQPTYWRVYQYIAYRALTGHSLSKAEMDLLNVDGWKVGTPNGDWSYSYSPDKNGVATWLAARATVAAPALKDIDVQADAGDYASFLNCQQDAFVIASKTLAQRLAQGGQAWAAIWTANQDAVFANCAARAPQGNGERGLIRPLIALPPLAAKSPEWLAKDYAYQTASALFYAGRYDAARQRYLDIAKDGKSPWQPLAKYLAARCLVRKASLMEDANPSAEALSAERTQLFSTARAELSAIAAAYPPAKAMLSWIDIRLQANARRRELSATLAKDKIGADTWQQLTDYLFLLDKIEGEKMVAADDDMSAWIGIMQASANDVYDSKDAKVLNSLRIAALAKARQQWAAHHAVHWLIAIMTNAKMTELTSDEIKAATKLQDDSPAYGMAQYLLAKGKLMQGQVADADSQINAMLKRPLAISDRNRWLRMKMVTAPTVDEFFAAAPRVAADEQRTTPIADEGKTLPAVEAFDDDFTQHLKQHFSLQELKRYQSKVPQSLQKWLNEMIWTRAVLLGDFVMADQVTDALMVGRDTTRHLYEQYKKAASPAAKKDAAMLILANTPELVPNVNSYWACDYSYALSGDDNMDRPPRFQSKEEQAQTNKELAKLKELPKRSDYLIPLIINWAKKNKANPEAPKALHFLIASTRNECGSGNNEHAKEHHYSRDAFQFLHAQFPKSEWTEQTRYYY